MDGAGPEDDYSLTETTLEVGRIISIIHLIGKDEAMLDNPVAKRTAIAAGIGALIAIPVPFVGPIFGAVVGGAYGFFTAPRHRGW